MINFKEFLQGKFHTSLDSPSVSLSTKSGHGLALKFDSKDRVEAAAYNGPRDIWLGSLCQLVLGHSLSELLHFNFKSWEETFGHDQFFWDLRTELNDECFFEPLELLKATLDTYRGREFLYKELDPLVCRCFGVREKDILEFLRMNEAPTVEGLSLATKAGMGCRSCVPQMKRWLESQSSHKKPHFYKEKPVAEWLLEIDYMLSCFPQCLDWKMEVESFKGHQVLISFDKDVPQVEEEEISKALQVFLGSSLDDGLVFFLRRSRSRHR